MFAIFLLLEWGSGGRAEAAGRTSEQCHKMPSVVVTVYGVALGRAWR